MPSLDDEYSSPFNYNFFIGLCVKKLEELNACSGINSTSKLQYFLTALKELGSNAELVTLLAGLNQCIQKFEYVDDSFKCGEFTITDEIFDLFCTYIGISTGCLEWKALEDYEDEKNMEEWEREFRRKEREYQEKINKAKNKDKKGISTDLIIQAVMREFHMSMDEVYRLNKYGLLELYSTVVSRIVNFEVMRVAAGTGNLSKSSKFNYWTNDNK